MSERKFNSPSPTGAPTRERRGRALSTRYVRSVKGFHASSQRNPSGSAKYPE